MTGTAGKENPKKRLACTIAANFDAYDVGLPFFGLAATVSVWLWLKSNYIPKGLSIFGVIAAAW